MECNIAILCFDQLNHFTAARLDHFWFVPEICCFDRLPYLDLATNLTMFCGRILGAIFMVRSCKWDAACFHKTDSAWCVSEQKHLQLLHGRTMPGIFIRTSPKKKGWSEQPRGQTVVGFACLGSGKGENRHTYVTPASMCKGILGQIHVETRCQSIGQKTSRIAPSHFDGIL